MLIPNPQGKIMPTIRLYTRPLCGWCQDAKRHLRERGLEFVEIDVGRDPDANAEMQRLTGQRYVPTIEVDGRVLANFDVRQLQGFLAELNL
jgi:glutaredoxin 3